MPREATIPLKVVQEEIQSIRHNLGELVEVYVGVGSVNQDGKFVFDVPQNFEVYRITATAIKIIIL